ncbi:hypothetical protein [Desulfobulbus sp.]|uniref:hypothetical protein n=1 Tax=Desulfobulbus sp. TaxID=895 RepID=UPI0027B96486|nr:hypothetical protein [Desulfobulbus sp.]
MGFDDVFPQHWTRRLLGAGDPLYIHSSYYSPCGQGKERVVEKNYPSLWLSYSGLGTWRGAAGQTLRAIVCREKGARCTLLLTGVVGIGLNSTLCD